MSAQHRHHKRSGSNLSGGILPSLSTLLGKQDEAANNNQEASLTSSQKLHKLAVTKTDNNNIAVPPPGRARSGSIVLSPMPVTTTPNRIPAPNPNPSPAATHPTPGKPNSSMQALVLANDSIAKARSSSAIVMSPNVPADLQKLSKKQTAAAANEEAVPEDQGTPRPTTALHSARQLKLFLSNPVNTRGATTGGNSNSTPFNQSSALVDQGARQSRQQVNKSAGKAERVDSDEEESSASEEESGTEARPLEAQPEYMKLFQSYKQQHSALQAHGEAEDEDEFVRVVPGKAAKILSPKVNNRIDLNKNHNNYNSTSAAKAPAVRLNRMDTAESALLDEIASGTITPDSHGRQILGKPSGTKGSSANASVADIISADARGQIHRVDSHSSTITPGLTQRNSANSGKVEEIQPGEGAELPSSPSTSLYRSGPINAKPLQQNAASTSFSHTSPLVLSSTHPQIESSSYSTPVKMSLGAVTGGASATTASSLMVKLPGDNESDDSDDSAADDDFDFLEAPSDPIFSPKAQEKLAAAMKKQKELEQLEKKPLKSLLKRPSVISLDEHLANQAINIGNKQNNVTGTPQQQATADPSRTTSPSVQLSPALATPVKVTPKAAATDVGYLNTAKSLVPADTYVFLRIRCINLARIKGFLQSSLVSIANPYLEFYRCRRQTNPQKSKLHTSDAKFWERVHRTEAAPNTLHPQFRDIAISAWTLCNNDYDRAILVKIFDKDNTGENPQFMGEVSTSLRELLLRLNEKHQEVEEDDDSEETAAEDAAAGANLVKFPVIRADMIGVNRDYTNSGHMIFYQVKEMHKLHAKKMLGKVPNPILNSVITIRKEAVPQDEPLSLESNPEGLLSGMRSVQGKAGEVRARVEVPELPRDCYYAVLRFLLTVQGLDKKHMFKDNNNVYCQILKHSPTANSEPLIEDLVAIPDTDWKLIYTSEIKYNTLEATFDPVLLTNAQLGYTGQLSYDLPLKLRILDGLDSSKPGELIGEVIVTLHTLLMQACKEGEDAMTKLAAALATGGPDNMKASVTAAMNPLMSMMKRKSSVDLTGSAGAAAGAEEKKDHKRDAAALMSMNARLPTASRMAGKKSKKGHNAVIEYPIIHPEYMAKAVKKAAAGTKEFTSLSYTKSGNLSFSHIVWFAMGYNTNSANAEITAATTLQSTMASKKNSRSSSPNREEGEEGQETTGTVLNSSDPLSRDSSSAPLSSDAVEKAKAAQAREAHLSEMKHQIDKQMLALLTMKAQMENPGTDFSVLNNQVFPAAASATASQRIRASTRAFSIDWNNERKGDYTDVWAPKTPSTINNSTDSTASKKKKKGHHRTRSTLDEEILAEKGADSQALAQLRKLRKGLGEPKKSSTDDEEGAEESAVSKKKKSKKNKKSKKHKKKSKDSD
jgi:hypothetical protein